MNINSAQPMLVESSKPVMSSYKYIIFLRIQNLFKQHNLLPQILIMTPNQQMLLGHSVRCTLQSLKRKNENQITRAYLSALQRLDFSWNYIFCYAKYSTSKPLHILQWKKAKRQSQASATHFWKKKKLFTFLVSV